MRDPTSKSKEHTVIIGAGCAGLAAGIALTRRGHRVTILEKSNRVGGLAGGIQIGKNTYEYGPHIFHTTDPEVLEDVKRIAGHVLQPFERTIQIKFLGKYFSYPLSMKDILTKLPLPTMIHAGLSFTKYFILGWLKRNSQEQNSETLLQRYYGDVLYRIFFRDYILKVWGISPREMDASFARQRIPRFDFVQIVEKLKKLFGKKDSAVSTKEYVEKVEGEFFTTSKGFSLICEAYAIEFQRQGGRLVLNADLESIRMEESGPREVRFQLSNGAAQRESLPCSRVISTIPISELPKKLEPQPPQEIIEAASDLKFRGICFVGLLIGKKSVLPASFMYFREMSFNRITDLSHFLVETEPENSTILIAEVTCQPEDPPWQNDKATIETAIEELCKEGLIKREDVIESHVYKLKHGYPIYTVNYAKNLEKVKDHLDTIPGLHTIGRQGLFAYINTHIAIKMGYELARKIGNPRPEIATAAKNTSFRNQPAIN